MKKFSAIPSVVPRNSLRSPTGAVLTPSDSVGISAGVSPSSSCEYFC